MGGLEDIFTRWDIPDDAQKEILDEIKKNKDLKQYEDVIIESAVRFNKVIESSPNAIVITDLQGNIIECNQAALEMNGYSEKSEFIGISAFEMIAEEDHEKAAINLKKTLDEGVVRNVEYQLLRKNGDGFIGELSASVINDSEGNPVSFVGIINDISEKKKVENALINSEMLYKETINSMPEWIHIIDDDFNFIVFSDSFKSINSDLGLETEVIGKNLFDVYSFLDESVREEYKAVFQDGEPLFTEERILIKGKEYFTETLKLPIFENDEVNKIVTIVRDISDKKISENNNKKLQEQVLRSQKLDAIGTLAGGIAHDFNNIIMIIMGHANLMMRKIDEDDKLYKNTTEILKASERAGKLSQQLLTFSQKKDYDMKTCTIKDIIEDLKDIAFAGHSNINSHITYHKEIYNVKVDKDQMYQALLNIVKNSIEAMPMGGFFNINVENYNGKPGILDEGDYLKIDIIDSGMGMDEEIQKHIFEPFFTCKSVGKGTGLGLTTSYNIIKKHNGFIECESKQGIGTKFSVYLPRSDEAIEEKVFKKEIIKGSGTVLVVDDEEELLDMIDEMLKGFGYSTILAKNGEEAVEIYEKRKDEIDVVLLDATMPVMNGKQTQIELMKINPKVKSILSSGYNISASTDEYKGIGIKEFVPKPYETEDLAEVIDKLIRE
ncbi:PAS domain S-box protein [Nanoarchaeota archaeon]